MVAPTGGTKPVPQIPNALDNKKNTVRPEGLEEGRSPRPQGRSFKFGEKADPESPRKGRRCTLVIKLALVGSDQEIWSNM